MTQTQHEAYLIFEVIWSDEHCIELTIQVSNGVFAGKISTYDSPDYIIEFTTKLNGFPNQNEPLTYTAGSRESHSYFEMTWHRKGPAGLVSIEVSIEESPQYLQLELLTEPSAIDVFHKKFKAIALHSKGSASLYIRS